MASFGNDESPAVMEALKNEINNAAKLEKSLERERASLMGEIERASITRHDEAELLALARLVKDRLIEGGTKESQLALIEALDVRVKLLPGKDKIEASCGLGGSTSILCLEGHDSIR
jgi:hypothetical protein